KRGTNEYGKEITYYLNYSDDSATITWQGRASVLLMQDQPIKQGDSLSIEGWGFVIIEEI
ncbi:MAG: hypothetical protein K2N77_13400, partial [Lachnospiraceae bacterium]|nr:hypothetical protein [Lachnospiraceae bacterium]